ncbi:hypothetical protein ASG60_18900 [Methylobacterium sp. Leaf469]|jgi:hypothetical protein|uniref:hypothetical protein n=1 Tax=unclassified Methylobacterium TaxID=2615210 RepID=UPI0006F5AF6B|nr:MULTISPECIES: hypothetical protein [unclassified Methylobacterium]KQO68728.1 hypothetical protein ASF22_19385 [Methylobacterium sp. Leaf87]KQP29454.1 hypothetical protein ASF27_20005 [Methylobacterium sp. Leaf102]KQU01006.1 hypothetical protein ASG60_18900 [Methylobacterium sp. Leaf469]
MAAFQTFDAPTMDPSSARHDRGILAGIAAIVFATVLIGTLAPASHRAAAVAPSADHTCAEWGDGCRVCQRREEGAACSLPGIACVPSEMRCLRRVGD